MEKSMLKKTLRKKLNKTLYQKENLKELKLCDEIELREFKAKLKLCKELSKEKNIIKFLILLKSLNGVNPLVNYTQCYIKESTKIIALKTIKKIMALFTQMNIFFFYFKYYRIDEKIIQKLIPYLKYTFYPKDSTIFKEGDFSTQFYFLLKGKISFKKKSFLVPPVLGISRGSPSGRIHILVNGILFMNVKKRRQLFVKKIAI